MHLVPEHTSTKQQDCNRPLMVSPFCAMVRAEIRAQREAESNNSADSNEAVSSTQLCTAHGYPQNKSLPQQPVSTAVEVRGQTCCVLNKDISDHDRRGAKDVEGSIAYVLFEHGYHQQDAHQAEER